MRVIVNATPLIALSLSNRLDLFRTMFAEVIVPSEVFEEIVVQGATDRRLLAELPDM